MSETNREQESKMDTTSFLEGSIEPMDRSNPTAQEVRLAKEEVFSISAQKEQSAREQREKDLQKLEELGRDCLVKNEGWNEEDFQEALGCVDLDVNGHEYGLEWGVDIYSGLLSREEFDTLSKSDNSKANFSYKNYLDIMREARQDSEDNKRRRDKISAWLDKKNFPPHAPSTDGTKLKNDQQHQQEDWEKKILYKRSLGITKLQNIYQTILEERLGARWKNPR